MNEERPDIIYLPIEYVWEFVGNRAEYQESFINNVVSLSEDFENQFDNVGSKLWVYIPFDIGEDALQSSEEEPLQLLVFSIKFAGWID